MSDLVGNPEDRGSYIPELESKALCRNLMFDHIV